MSSDDIDDFFVHQVIVRTYLGVSGNNVPLYDDPVAINGKLSRRRRYVRGANGDQVVSESSYAAPLDDNLNVLTPQSLVIFDSNGEPFGAGTFGTGGFGGADETGVQTTVISTAVSEGGGFIEGLDCIRAYLQ